MFIKLVAIIQMEIKCSPEVRILWRQNSQTLWSAAKSHLKQGGWIVRLIFSCRNSGYSITVAYAYKEKEIQHR